MNGHSPFPDPLPAALPDSFTPTRGREDADLLRFSAALLASVTVHATAILLPFLGVSHLTARPGLHVPPDPGHPLQVTLKRPAMATRPDASDTTRAVPTVELPPPPNPAPPAAASPAPLPDAPPALAPSGSIAPPVPQTPAERSLGADLLPVSAPDYYPVERLTKRPQPMKAAPLDTQETAPIVASGSLVMKLWIDSYGQVVNAEVQESTMPETFSAHAIDAFRRVHFIPGEIDGRAVGVVMRIEVRYEDGRVLPN